MQYTLRNIPGTLDAALRARAKSEGKSLNEVAIRAMVRGMGLVEAMPRQRDLSDVAGTWVDDPEFDVAIADQDRVDPDLWR